MNAKAPSLLVSGLFLVATLVGYFLLGTEQTGATLTGALSLVGMLWRFWQEYNAPVDAAGSAYAIDRDMKQSAFSRMFWS